jgi:DNA polymerase V
MKQPMFLCIHLKSFYGSVECVERGLDPMTTNLVVADPDRSHNTICLAITPAMKKLGIKNRCRVREIPSNVKYITAPPRMQFYIDYAAEIYGVYLKYVSKDDIHVYSIDEAFLDITNYLSLYNLTAKELGKKIMQDVLDKTGIRARCGIGTNLYLTKVALDITAKHSPDFIGYLDEELYKEQLWDHQPLTDFWRIGVGTQARLAKYGIHTMRDVANFDEELLYNIFGIDAELLIDHAWGRETCTMADIKSYKSSTKSLSSGQVLMRDYNFEEGKLIAKEMIELLALDLVSQNLVTKSVTLCIGYSKSFEKAPATGSFSLSTAVNSDKILREEITKLYDKIVDRYSPIRRVNISCNNVSEEEYVQFSLFDDVEAIEKERKIQSVVVELKKKYGKDAVLKGMNFNEGATTRERNHQIGGHKSGT